MSHQLVKQYMRILLSPKHALFFLLQSWFYHDCLSADAKDASFASAFDIMACAFVADNPAVTNKVTEAIAFTTIYNKYYGPCMKKRKVLEGIEVAPNL